MALQRRSRTTAADRARARGPFAAVVTARRHELELTQSDLADLAGVARGPVVSLEAGRTVSLDVLLAILEVLGLHLELTRGTAGTGVTVSSDLSTQYNLDDPEIGVQETELENSDG
jgi:transcriptional regulator with XRE-family HTH domain